MNINILKDNKLKMNSILLLQQNIKKEYNYKKLMPPNIL